MLIKRDDNHIYTVDNQTKPSVTQVMTKAGLIDDRWYDDYSAYRGSMVHKICEYIDEGIDYKSFVDSKDLENFTGFINAYLRFTREVNPEWGLKEYKVYNKLLDYCGTLDRFGKVSGNLVIVDLKTGSMQPWTGIQIEAYRRAIMHSVLDYDFSKVKRYGLNLKSNGTYKLKEFTDINDWKVFQSALNIHNWSKNNGK